ncbi:MAG: MBL fold metallo-hydrolase [Hespellia sp.]|nr:MBL fold metallo-hydrolase [Hespellia sp.]
MKVQYIYHSGFLVEFEDAVFIFDYWQGELPEFQPEKKVFVFSSHWHHDHFKSKVFDWAERFPNIYYILSKDIKAKPDKPLQILRVKARETYEIGGCRIRTLRSTDEGVAFVVEYQGKTIYHAGDLNWWHWEGESKSYNNNMKTNYQREIQLLADESIDVAFIPVDDRLEEQYYWGIDWFMRHTDTKIAFPMHLWEKYELCDKLLSEPDVQPYKDRIQKVEYPGQIFVLEEKGVQEASGK